MIVGDDDYLETMLQNPTLQELNQQDLDKILPQTSVNSDNETVHPRAENTIINIAITENSHRIIKKYTGNTVPENRFHKKQNYC